MPPPEKNLFPDEKSPCICPPIAAQHWQARRIGPNRTEGITQMTNTHDFTRQVYVSDATHAGIVSNDPRRAEQMRNWLPLWTWTPSRLTFTRRAEWRPRLPQRHLDRTPAAGQTCNCQASVPAQSRTGRPSTADLRWLPPAISRAS